MDMKKEIMKNIIIFILLLIITLGVFQYTIAIRKPWFNTISEGRHQWLSGATLKYSRMWWQDGILNSKFLLLSNPKSVEFPNLSSRIPELSYPVGSIIPIYLISKIIRQEPSLTMIMGYNLLNHFLITFILSLTIFIFLKKLDINYIYSFTLSIIPILTELFLPGPLYWHQNVFFADQAVILPFVLIIFFELLTDDIKNKKLSKLINILSSVTFFYGMITDWLFIFIALTIYIKRIILEKNKKNYSKLIRQSIIFWLPISIGLILHFIQILRFSSIDFIVNKLNYYSIIGFNSKIFEFSVTFWLGYMSTYFGRAGSIMLMGSIFLFILILIQAIILKKQGKNIDIKIKKIIVFISIAIFPCLLQIYTFPHHSYVHDFSTLKFSIPLAFLPFILIPLAVSFLFKLKIELNKINIKATLIIVIILISAGVYVFIEHRRFSAIFPIPNRTYQSIGIFISQNSKYEDVIFSPDTQILDNPPQLLSLAMKRIYKINSLDEIMEKTENIKQIFKINIFLTSKNINNNISGLEELISNADELIEDKKNDFYLYKIPADKFLKVYNTI